LNGDNKGQDMNEFYGARLTINENVKFVGKEEDPSESPLMKSYSRALKEIYQPERLNPKASKEDVIV